MKQPASSKIPQGTQATDEDQDILDVLGPLPNRPMTTQPMAEPANGTEYIDQDVLDVLGPMPSRTSQPLAIRPSTVALGQQAPARAVSVEQDRINRAAAIAEERKRKSWDPTIGGKWDPTEEMSQGELALAGLGSKFSDIALGARQVFGQPGYPETWGGDIISGTGAEPIGPTYADIEEKRRRDEMLLAQPAGQAGKVGGTALEVAGGAALFPANTILGLTAAGGATGLLQPVTSPGERAENALAGAAIGGGIGAVGAALPLVGRAYQGARGLSRPFRTREVRGLTGAEEVAARRALAMAEAPRETISRTTGGPAMAPAQQGAGAPRYGREAFTGLTAEPTITGAAPTLAEQTLNPNLAQLQDVLTATPGVGGAIKEAYAANNLARINTLERIARTPEQRARLAEIRRNEAEISYDVPNQSWIPVNDQLREILQRPHTQEWINRARAAAANRPGAPAFGMHVDENMNGEVSGQALHDIRMGIDWALRNPHVSGLGGVESASLTTTRRQLEEQLREHIPGYAEATQTYSALSLPLNQAQIAQHLLERGTTATQDISAEGLTDVLSNAKLRNLLRDEQGLIASATESRGAGTTLEQVFRNNPRALAEIRAIQDETQRLAASGKAGAGANSATYQRFALADMLSRMGLEGSNTAQAVARSLGLGKILESAEPAVQNALVRIAIDPAYAQRLTAIARLPAQRQQTALNGILRDAGFATRATATGAAIESR